MAWLKRRAGSGIFYVLYRVPGRKHPKPITTSTRDRREAQAFLEEWERARADGAAPPTSDVLTVEGWGAQWLDERRTRGKLDWPNEQGHLRHHLNPVLGARPLELVTKAEMLEWVHALPAQRRHDGKLGPLSPRTVNKCAETARLLFKAAAKRDLIAVNPCVWDASDLPAKEDRDPTRAREGGFSLLEVAWLIGDPRVPWDRRVLYGLEFLTGMRTGEAADRRWGEWEPEYRGDLGRLVVATSWNTRHHLAKPTKTRVVKWIPVHPVLAMMLRDWKREGWPKMFGRAPGPDDLIVPAARGGARNNGYSWRLWAENDLPALELEHQRHYESRSTFRSLALAGGANREDLDLITHPSPRRARDLYNRLGLLWGRLCAAVRCVQVAPAAKPAADAAGPARLAAVGATGTRVHDGGGSSPSPSGDSSPDVPKAPEFIRSAADGDASGETPSRLRFPCSTANETTRENAEAVGELRCPSSSPPPGVPVPLYPCPAPLEAGTALAESEIRAALLALTSGDTRCARRRLLDALRALEDAEGRP